MDRAARVVRVQRLDAHGAQPHAGGGRCLGACPVRFHGDVADGTMIRLRQGVTFRLSNGRMERGLLFRNDAIGPRTHAYIAPDASVERIGLSPSTLSTARPKSPIVTTSRSSRIANIPASVHIAWMSAPVVPSHRPARTP